MRNSLTLHASIMFPAGKSVESAQLNTFLAPESIHNELDVWAKLQFTFDMDDERSIPSKKGHEHNTRRQRSASAAHPDYGMPESNQQQVKAVPTIYQRSETYQANIIHGRISSGMLASCRS